MAWRCHTCGAHGCGRYPHGTYEEPACCPCAHPHSERCEDADDYEGTTNDRD
jgi:hypothetical protein